PMDVQADDADVEPVRPVRKRGAAPPDTEAVAAGARVLLEAKRPVILAGGGVSRARAEPELLALAEFLGAPVVTTVQAMDCFPADHRLSGKLGGTKGTSIGNALTSGADAVLAVGCRFADETASSYRAGVTYSIPPTKLVHLDIDPGEIGKNYPVEAGIVADAAEGLRALLAECSRASSPREWESGEYALEVALLRERWLEETAALRDSDAVPPTVPRFYRELREALDRDAIVVTSSGHAQACVLEFPFYVPRTSVTTGGFSTMGFSYPAAMGAKLAAPDRQVVAVIGDGDFMMTMQEMATAKQYGIGVVAVILNNAGWYSIRDLQIDALGEDRVYATEFATPDGEAYTPDFAAAARAFGLRGERVDRPEEVSGAIDRALAGEGPALIEVMVQREFPYSGSTVSGWWDVPVPAYLEDRRARYLAERAGEQPAPEDARRRLRPD
ncbi:MAG: thiamine pyrophosphate-binding protein, partial [Chloroflexi bacterium]|nr:thiamine pyrophosphate-binding protein [Chloroflexota bacterium]